MSELRLRPVFVVKPNTMTRSDIRRVEKLSGICIVECAEPESARFLDLPMSADVSMSIQARAALQLLRNIMRQPSPDLNRGAIMKWFVEIMLEDEKIQPVAPVKK